MSFIPDEQLLKKLEMEALNQMQYILIQGWTPILAVSHSPFAIWQPYGMPLLEVQEYEVLLEEVKICIKKHPDCKVQLIAQDKTSKQARAKFLVYHPFKVEPTPVIDESAQH